MVLRSVRYAPPMSGSLMRLKKLPIAVNISVEVKEVSSPHSPSRKKGLGCVSSSVAPGGKKYTCRKGNMQIDASCSQ